MAKKPNIIKETIKGIPVATMKMPGLSVSILRKAHQGTKDIFKKVLKYRKGIRERFH